MDWGLFDRTTKENFMLRDELVYRFRAYYYVAIVEDVIIRFAWILPLIFSNLRSVDVEIITTVGMFAEVTRSVTYFNILVNHGTPLGQNTYLVVRESASKALESFEKSFIVAPP